MLSYQLRNILIVIGFLLIVSLTGGYLTLFYYPEKIEKANKEVVRVKKQINSLDGIEYQFAPLRKTLKEKQERFNSIDKRIVRTLSSASTYYYLNLILNRIGFIDFNMMYTGTRQFGKYGYNIYRIRGEASYQKIYQLVWYLERGPFLYHIERLSLKGVESKDPETKELQLLVPFEMELHGYFADLPKLPRVKRSLNDVKVVPVHNPFTPYVFRNIPANTEGLLEVERAELKAIVSNKALIADQNGKVYTLSVGDRVFLGYLTRIDPKGNRVEFTLNKGGVVEKVELKLNFGTAKESKE
ncbi:MAG: hypothetical protein D6748_16150 [Calditrichaeota bacterium]|nr:MAG: hypothetical protein D6748_16150 [Calditrichota bacterium]